MVEQRDYDRMRRTAYVLMFVAVGWLAVSVKLVMLIHAAAQEPACIDARTVEVPL